MYGNTLVEQQKKKNLLLAQQYQGQGYTDSQLRAYEAGLIRGVALTSKKPRQDTDKTLREYAAGVKLQLGKLYVVISDGQGEPFLTQAESDAAHASFLPDNHERYLVAHMTPIFLARLMPSFPNDFVLVNSEEYAWIPSADLVSNYTAPDHFVSPHYLVRFHPPYSNAPAIHNGEYGTFPVFNARRSLAAIGDAKKKLNNSAEGDFMKFLESTSFSSTTHEIIVVRGFVYDWETCSLMTAVNGTITQITTVKWVTPGSRAIVCNYFRDYERDWDGCLRVACEGMNVTIPRYSTISVPADAYQQCILGAGASGRVFEVMRDVQGGEPRQLAMKLVMGDECCDELAIEFQLVEGLPSSVQNCIVGVETGSLWRGTLMRENHVPLSVSAFLMNTIGLPFHHPSEVTEVYGPLILESLSELHAARVSHNDARYKNVVRIESDRPMEVMFRWIDLGTCGVPTSIKFARDLVTFFESINRPFNDVAVRQYANRTAQQTWNSPDERRHAARQLWT